MGLVIYVTTLWHDMKNAMKIIFFSDEAKTIWLLSLRAGWTLFQRLWGDYFWLLMVMTFLTFVIDIWLLPSIALTMIVILLARPTVELPTLEYLFMRQTTIRATILGVLLGLADHGYTYSLKLAQAASWLLYMGVAGTMQALGFKAHYFFYSPLFILLALYVLDAPFTLKAMKAAIGWAFYLFLQLYPLLMIIYLLFKKLFMSVMVSALAQVIPYQATLFIVTAFLLPWYVALLTQLYIRAVRKGLSL